MNGNNKNLPAESDRERFTEAILIYDQYDKVDRNMIRAVIKGLGQWASLLPRKPIIGSKIQLKNTFDLTPEQNEILAICDRLLLLGQVRLSEALQKKLSLLIETTQKLDKIYPIIDEQDESLEQKLVFNCKRQVHILSKLLEAISESVFQTPLQTDILNAMDMTEICKSRPTARREQRAMQIEKIRDELLRYIKNTAQICWEKHYSDADFIVPQRPLKKDLARLTAMTAVSVSRCFKDPKAVEIRLLWKIAASPENMMQYIKPR